MKIDRRLREGFERITSEIEPDVSAHLARVQRTAAKRRTVRRIGAALAVAAAVLALAARFKRSPAKRTVLFVNFTGEELGLLGSAYFADHAPVPISSVQAMVNFDMIGRLRNDKLIVYGVATATEMPDILAKANTGGLKLNAVGDGFGPSDHASFYAKDMPVLHMFTDLHDQYHRASDVASTIDAAGEVRVVEFAERVVRDLADRPARLTFTKAPTTSTPRAAERTGSGVYLGSIPDMGSADVVGMKITGVRAGSPADLGGVFSCPPRGTSPPTATRERTHRRSGASSPRRRI